MMQYIYKVKPILIKSGNGINYHKIEARLLQYKSVNAKLFQRTIHERK